MHAVNGCPDCKFFVKCDVQIDTAVSNVVLDNRHDLYSTIPVRYKMVQFKHDLFAN
jgi:hypothetical protein